MDVSTLIVTSLLMLIAITIWQRWRTSKDRKCLETIPGPKPYPLIGNAQDFRTTEELISVYIRYMKNYGDLMKFWIGSTLKILISDPNVSEALLTSTKNITKDSGYRFLHSWLGEGLLTSGPTRWRKHRKILTPAFHFQILEKFVATFENATTVFIQKLRKHKDIRNLDIYPLVDLCSLDIICETSMGTAVDAQENEESEYVTAVSEMTRIMCEKMISPMKQIHFLYRFTKDYQSEKAALKILHDQTHFVIKQRKNEILKMQENSVAVEEEFYKKPKMNFLDILLLSKIDGEPLSDEAIREEVDTFMFEGHDTTASAMSFAFFCLANHPEVQVRNSYPE
ncbi:hypothetical protein HHI36_021878 [Cryptolaemus montrouzieri]|uniref:Cytochrome P450 n=1 Tax=Cryptolaemus montrouzieri TaxID=559131 RepID=A0ABD2MYI6_9CUCU